MISVMFNFSMNQVIIVFFYYYSFNTALQRQRKFRVYFFHVIFLHTDTNTVQMSFGLYCIIIFYKRNKNQTNK